MLLDSAMYTYTVGSLPVSPPPPAYCMGSEPHDDGGLGVRLDTAPKE